jgi:ATP/maltotriose-dependent transcriptional regulator MalT
VQTQDGAAIELTAGDPVAAEQELREGYDILAELGETGFRSTVAAYLADALFAQGRLEEAGRAAEDAIELAQEDDFDPIARARLVQARIALDQGDLEAAKALAESAVALEEQTDYIERHADTLVALARIREGADDIAEAVVAARKALALYVRKGSVVGSARARALLDELGLPASAG